MTLSVMEPRAEEREVLKPDEVADFLRCSRSKVYSLVKQGLLPYRQVGGSIRFSRTALRNWLAG